MYMRPYHWMRRGPSGSSTGFICSGRCCQKFRNPFMHPPCLEISTAIDRTEIRSDGEKIAIFLPSSPIMASLQDSKSTVTSAFRNVQDKICDFLSAEDKPYREDAWQYGNGTGGGIT